MSFIANFIRFPAAQNCKNRLRIDKVTESIKVGTFLRRSVCMCHSTMGLTHCYKTTVFYIYICSFFLPQSTLCPNKRPPFYFSNNSVKN